MAVVIAADIVVSGNFGVAVAGEARLRRRTAHVEGDRLRVAEGASYSCGADHSCDRAGLHHPDRLLDRGLQRHHTTARLHDENFPFEPPRLKPFAQRAEIARYDRTD